MQLSGDQLVAVGAAGNRRPYRDRSAVWSRVVKRTETHRFAVLPRRWIVELAFAWLTNFRRLVRDYEISPKQAETMIKVAMIHLLLKRLA